MTIYQLFRRLLACTLALLLAIDIAAACRLWSACNSCSTPVSYRVIDPCAPTAGCGWSNCGGCSTVLSTGCGCDACNAAPACGQSSWTDHDHHSHGEHAHDDHHHHGHHGHHEHGHHEHGHHEHGHHEHGHHEHGHENMPTPAQPTPFADGGFSSAPLIDESEAAADEQDDIFEAGAPAVQPSEPAPPVIDLVAPAEEADVAEDLVAPEPADDMLFDAPEPANEVESAFDDEAMAADDMDDAMDAEQDDAFMDLDDEQAADEDALFGFDDDEDAPTEEMPADEPADAFGGFDAPVADEAAEDELFGFGNEDAPAEEAPADEAPVAEPADDFGAFGEDPTEAAEEDLFGFGEDDAATAEETPAEEMPAEEMPADEFGGFDDADFGDDGFDADAFGDDAAETDGFGDAFDEQPAEEANEAAEDDLFGDFGMILSEPGGYDSDRPRTWIDNSGRFSCQARLVAIDGDTVRLQKTNGGVSRVPLGRLSNADLEFVSRQSIARHDLEVLLSGSTVRTAAR